MSTLRLDRLLFFLRFAASRTKAHHWVCEGHFRCNGERGIEPDRRIGVGDVLTLPLKRAPLIIEITAMPSRRGPKDEAQSCYRVLDAGGALRQSGGQAAAPAGEQGKTDQ